MTTLVQPSSSAFSIAQVNMSSATTTAIVAAVTGKVIQVFRALLVTAGTDTLIVKDGSTALTAAMSLTTGVPWILEFDGNPWFTTSAGNALNFTTGASVQLSGVIYYTQAFPTTQ